MVDKKTLLEGTFYQYFNNSKEIMMYVKNTTDNEVLFNSLSQEVKETFHNYSEDVFQGLLGHLKSINTSESDINILKNPEIYQYALEDFVQIEGVYYRIKKTIVNTHGKQILILVLNNFSKIKEHIEGYKAQANYDSLTKLYNRNCFMIKYEDEKKLLLKYQKSLSLIMIDIDKFKNVNDTFGHEFGDQVLKKVAKVLENHSRDSDILARFGGEEFILLLPLTGKDTAILIAERLRKRMKEELKNFGGKTNLTISLGVTSHNFRQGDVNFEELYKASDKALYTAKNKGRDMVIYEDN